MRWSKELSSFAPPETFPSGQAVVGLTSSAEGADVAQAYGLRVVGKDPVLRTIVVEGNQRALHNLDDSQLLDSRLRYVEPVRRLELQHRRSDPLTYNVDQATGRPYEWNFGAVHLDRALNLSHGDPNIMVGIVDTGFAQVSDLSGKFAKAWSFTNEPTTAYEDTVGHGTFVASIIAANNDDGVGLAGFCGACRLTFSG
jgi:subtilisin family serine protease